jgi:site-specific DNA recombinase
MKLDRVARNVREFLATVDQLKAWHCDLLLVKEAFDTSTPHGRFALTMFAAMAELEASTIIEWVMSGKQQKASKGGYNGSRCPLGYVYNGAQFAVVAEQAQTVRSVFTLFLHGQSINAIAHL